MISRTSCCAGGFAVSEPRYFSVAASVAATACRFVSQIEGHLSRLTAILNAVQLAMVALVVASAVAILYLSYLLVFNPLARLQAGLPPDSGFAD